MPSTSLSNLTREFVSTVINARWIMLSTVALWYPAEFDPAGFKLTSLKLQKNEQMYVSGKKPSRNPRM